MPGSVFLAGENVELRTIEEDDYEKLRDWVNHYDVRRFIGISKPTNLKQETEFVENELEEENTILLGICLDGELIGDIALEEKENGVAELGIMIGPEYHGNGYGTEASRLVINHAFEQLRYHKIKTRVAESNEKSTRVWEKLGFQQEGTLREHFFLDGEYRDMKLYGLLEDEWNE